MLKCVLLWLDNVLNEMEQGFLTQLQPLSQGLMIR